MAINAGTNLVGFAAQIVVAFLIAPVLVHGLGDRRYGIWSLVESVLAYLTVLDLGISAAVVRYVAKFEATGDRDRLNRIFSTSLALFGMVGAVALTVTLGLAFLWSRPLGVAPDLVGDVRWLLVLLGANIALGLPLGTFASVLDGLGRYPAKTAVRTTALVARAILLWIVIRRGGGLPQVATVITLANLAEHTAMALAVWHYLPTLRFALSFINRETLASIRGYSALAFIGMVASRISFQTDSVVIGAFLAPEYITFFAIAGRLVEYAKNAVRAATTVFTPAVSELEARGDHEGIRRVLLRGTRYVLLLILPIEAALLLLGKPFLALWLGESYAAQSYATLVILSLPLALMLSQSVSGRILFGIGKLRWLVMAMVLEASANLGLSIWLVHHYGIEGVAWGTTIPSLVLNVATVLYIARTVDVRITHYLRTSFVMPLFLACLPSGIWWIVTSHVELRDWWDLIAVGAVGLVPYALALGFVEGGFRRIMRPPGGERPTPQHAQVATASAVAEAS